MPFRVVSIPNVGVVCTDVFDTVTMSEQNIDLAKVLLVVSGELQSAVDMTKTKDLSSSLPMDLQIAMGSCHSIQMSPSGDLMGNPFGFSMLKMVGWRVTSHEDNVRYVLPLNGKFEAFAVDHIGDFPALKATGAILGCEGQRKYFVVNHLIALRSSRISLYPGVVAVRFPFYCERAFRR